MSRQLRVDLPRSGRTTERLPEGRPVVEIVRDDRPVPLRRRHGGLGDLGRAVGQTGEDAAGVEPAHTPGEQFVPVDVGRPHLGDGGVGPIGDADGDADAESALGEVEPVARGPADSIVGNPPHVGRVQASGQHQILDKTSDLVVGQCGHDRRPLPEAAA